MRVCFGISRRAARRESTHPTGGQIMERKRIDIGSLQVESFETASTRLELNNATSCTAVPCSHCCVELTCGCSNERC
jgi:hypothetical protein